MERTPCCGQFKGHAPWCGEGGDRKTESIRHQGVSKGSPSLGEPDWEQRARDAEGLLGGFETDAASWKAEAVGWRERAERAEAALRKIEKACELEGQKGGSQ